MNCNELQLNAVMGFLVITVVLEATAPDAAVEQLLLSWLPVLPWIMLP
jgi:hypothetical protein